jgi:hypothetical protein
MSGWGRLQDALIAASFWALDPEELRLGLDGSDWLIEGRRKDIYRAVSRWSPDGGHLRPRQAVFRTGWSAAGGSEDLLIRLDPRPAENRSRQPAPIGLLLETTAERLWSLPPCMMAAILSDVRLATARNGP